MVDGWAAPANGGAAPEDQSIVRALSAKRWPWVLLALYAIGTVFSDALEFGAFHHAVVYANQQPAFEATVAADAVLVAVAVAAVATRVAHPLAAVTRLERALFSLAVVGFALRTASDDITWSQLSPYDHLTVTGALRVTGVLGAVGVLLAWGVAAVLVVRRRFDGASRSGWRTLGFVVLIAAAAARSVIDIRADLATPFGLDAGAFVALGVVSVVIAVALLATPWRSLRVVWRATFALSLLGTATGQFVVASSFHDIDFWRFGLGNAIMAGGAVVGVVGFAGLAAWPPGRRLRGA